MPSAICNTCHALLHWPQQRWYEKHVCGCGSADLSQVSGHLAEINGELVWEYKDRKGKVRATVQVDTKQHQLK